MEIDENIKTDRPPEMPGDVPAADEYRRRLAAYSAVEPTLKKQSKCHVCVRYRGLYKLCPACRYFTRHPERTELYLRDRNYTVTGLMLIILGVLCNTAAFYFGGLSIGVGIFSRREAGVIYLISMIILFIGLLPYGITLNRIQRWRVIHGQKPPGAGLIIGGMWFYVTPFILWMLIQTLRILGLRSSGPHYY
jgi:hypothetical protein